MADWIKVQDKLPPEEKVVETKIDDGKGCRNIQKLMRIKNLWFFPDGSMYVYYTPTHWREILYERCGYLNTCEVATERRVWRMKDRETVENNANHHCCGTCLFFNGDLSDNEQFCDELETYVNAKAFCCNRWKEKY